MIMYGRHQSTRKCNTFLPSGGREKVINNKKKNLGKNILNNSNKERDTNEKDWGGELGKKQMSIYTNNRIFGNLFSTNTHANL